MNDLSLGLGGRRSLRTIAILGALLLLALGAATLSLGLGAVAISPARVAEIVLGDIVGGREASVVFNIRLPRTLLGLVVGAGLAVSGALLQGLFRNPLPDPGLVGISAGAGLSAAFVIIAGERVLAWLGLPGPVPYWLLPIGSFAGGLAATLTLYLIATRSGRTSVATMLLAGIALASMCGALTGLLIYVSNDAQLRDFTFWTLGSLSGANWAKVQATALAILPVLVLLPLLGRAMNALVLGEAEAFHLGIHVERLKRLVILAVAVAVGAGVAAAGVIGFVGLVVPNALRIALGPEHRLLLPASALVGGALLVCADIVARLVVAPAELPIGVVTALIGAPAFLWLLLGRARVGDA